MENEVKQNIFEDMQDCNKKELEIEKSRIPMYIKKIPGKNGKYTYIYEKNEKSAIKKVDFCNSKLLSCSLYNAQKEGEKFIFAWAKQWNPGYKCETLNNTKVALDVGYKKKQKRYGISIFHLSHKGKQFGETLRSPKDIYERARLLPIAKEILTDKTKGILTEVRTKYNKVEYSVCGKVLINNKVQIVSVIVTKFKPGIKTYVSIINKAVPNKSDTAFITDVYLVDPKTLTNQQRLNLGLSELPSHLDKTVEKSTKGMSGKLRNSILSDRITKHSQNISQINKKSNIKLDYDGKNMLHKSFDIEISDITESNREKKIEQTEKALNAIYNKQPFVIRHITAKKGEGVLKNLVLRISDFDKNKIEKAVHSMQFTLDTKIKAGSGEAFLYKSQEELTDLFVEELTEKTKAIYSFVIAYFGLPEIRVLSKSDLKYKGKVVYDPETGKPISKAEWNKFVKTLEDFLNRNYKGIGKRIVLSAETLGRMLERLSKSKSLSELKIYIFYVHKVFTEDELKKEATTRTSNPSSLRLTGKPLYKFILQDVLNVNEEPQSNADIKDNVNDKSQSDSKKETSDAEEHTNRSEAMKGNQNAKKNFTEADKQEVLNNLKNPTEKILKVDYSRKNYNELFPRGKSETPLGKIRLSPHQFERLGEKDKGARKQYLGLLSQTLKNPNVIIDEIDSQGRPAKVWIKSVIDENKTRYYIAITPSFDGVDVVVSNGPREYNQIENKIKMASSFYYKAEGGSRTARTGVNPLPSNDDDNTNSKNVNGKTYTGKDIVNTTTTDKNQKIAVAKAKKIKRRGLATTKSLPLFFIKDGRFYVRKGL